MLNWLKSKLPFVRRIDSSSKSDIERDGFVPTSSTMPSFDELRDVGLVATPELTAAHRFDVEADAATPLIGSLEDRRRKTVDW